jgi:hypothetical protein
MKTKIPQVRVLVFNGEDIGMGFNSDSGFAVGTALDFDASVAAVSQEANATAEIVTTHDAMMESLGVSAAAKGRYGFASGSLKVDFSKKTAFNSVSSFVVAKMVINNSVNRGRNFRIKADASRLLLSDRAAFDRAFGDCFVRGQFTGGEFYCVMRITSLDTSVQTDLSITLQAEINGLVGGGSFQGNLTKANQNSQSRSEFFVSFYQKGGSGADEIGTTLSIEEVKARLHNFPTAVANHPFPYEIEVATYDTVPIPLPTKEQEESLLLALADAEQKKLQSLQVRNDLEFAAEHSEFFENPPAPQDLRAASQIYLRATNAAIQHSVRLSRGEIDPPQLLDLSTFVPPIVLPVVTLKRKSRPIRVPDLLDTEAAFLNEALHCLSLAGVDDCIAGIPGVLLPVRAGRQMLEFLDVVRKPPFTLTMNPASALSAPGVFIVGEQSPPAGTLLDNVSEVSLQFIPLP